LVNTWTTPTNEVYQERYREKNIIITDLFQTIHDWYIQEKILWGCTERASYNENQKYRRIFLDNIPGTVFYQNHFKFIAGGLGGGVIGVPFRGVKGADRIS